MQEIKKHLKCDNCGATAETAVEDDIEKILALPEGWRRLELKNHSEDISFRIDICPSCKQGIVKELSSVSGDEV